MIDWLNTHPVTSATEASQIFDAPETPAPIFAYRALKGILFGSPDYDDEDEDKENIAPANPVQKTEPPAQDKSGSRTINDSPLRPKSIQSPDSRTRERHPVSPSPRKRRQLSPTKSILRTPGIPTPRRQNVNVTFKDVRPSVSPNAVTTKLLAAKSEARVARPSDGAIQFSVKKITEVPRRVMKTADVVETLPVPVYDMSSVDAYLKSTEREMKKLVRYSQRMKEYARVSQRENAALKRERDELRRELEELRQAKVMTRAVSEEKAMKEASDTRVGGTYRGADKALEKGRRGSISDAKRLEKIHTTKATWLPSKSASGRGSRVCEPRTEPKEENLDQKDVGNAPMQDGGQIGGVFSKKGAATTAQLPPDRLAAAKERLRVKNEERRRALSAAME